jgi:SAM-dependent methyltransferase
VSDRLSDVWANQIEALKLRFDREYRHEPFDLPEEVESMPLFREWVSHSLAAKVASPFWELAEFRKDNRCLDIGCGVSFLIYPWRDWSVFFYGQEISSVAREALNSRGSQLNSKLFKGVQLGPAHHLQYDDGLFDRAIATGFSCYFALDYWREVLLEAKRVLKPGGFFIFDAIDPSTEMAENWAILEMYLGVEVFLHPLQEVTDLVKDVGGKVIATQPGELFQLYKISFS